MKDFRKYYYSLILILVIAVLTVPQVKAFSFPNSSSLFQKLIQKPKILPKASLKPKPSKSPKPSPSVFPSPTPSPSPTPLGSSLTWAGFKITPASVDLTINLNEAKEAFSLKSITAGGFQIYGYPTEYGPGINWDVSSGGMTPGASIVVGMQVSSNTPSGVYTGTGRIVNLTTSEELTFPVKVTVVSPPGFPFVKIKYPNGGEVFSVGDKVNIQWEGDKLNGTCQLGYTIGPGTLDWINFSFPGSERSFEWTAKEWIADAQPDNMKITIDCYTEQGLVSDTSDNFFTVNPLSPQIDPGSPTPPISPKPLNYPGVSVWSSGFTNFVNNH